MKKMTIENFIKAIRQDLEIQDTIILDQDTNFLELDCYDSMSKLFLITLADEHFDVELSAEQIDELTTIRSFMELIGLERFEEEGNWINKAV
jgi:acyl carrier protein